jgi:hypothetical protein
VNGRPDAVNVCLAAALSLVLVAAAEALLADEGRAVARPEDTGAALENPGMGWVLHFYDNVPANYGSRLELADTVDDFPGLTVIYLRIPWSYIEPQEGRFNWAVLDGPAQRWVAKGKQIALRLSCSESWTRYATPQWVQEAGAKGHEFRPGAGVTEDGPFWEPDYDDPIFLDKLGHFLAAVAARYDGNPEVAWIDVGSFGVWGEGHTYHSTKLPYSADTIKRHIDLHLKHFKRTLLAANDDFALQDRGTETIDYAREHGLTLRDDSILVQGGDNAYFNAAMAEGIWQRLPVVLESEHYGGSRDRGNWQDGSKYVEAIEEYHASYASIHWWPREFLAECGDLIAKINRRLGYRLQLAEASWPARLRVESEFTFSATWRNAGVAPCLPGGFPALTLKDEKGGIGGVFVDDSLDVRSLPVGRPGEAGTGAHERTFTLPFNFRAGVYDVFISVGTRTGSPRIALPLPGDDGERRYRLGKMEVTGDYAVRVGELTQNGDRWLLPLKWTVHLPLPQGATPFCHFERGGAIAFQGLPDPECSPAVLEQPGEVDLGCIFSPPEDARGRTFSVKVGLWIPERLAQPDERLIPDRGELDRRVVVGSLEVAEDAGLTFTPASARR